MRSSRVDENFFPLLGVQPELGRVFSKDEEQRGEAVIVVSHRIWLSRFGGAASVLGSDLIMDGRKSRIIGVMPDSFRYPFLDTEVWQAVTVHPYWLRNRSAPRSDSSCTLLRASVRDLPGPKPSRR